MSNDPNELIKQAWDEGYAAAYGMARGYGHVDYWTESDAPENPYRSVTTHRVTLDAQDTDGRRQQADCDCVLGRDHAWNEGCASGVIQQATQLMLRTWMMFARAGTEATPETFCQWHAGVLDAAGYLREPDTERRP